MIIEQFDMYLPSQLNSTSHNHLNISLIELRQHGPSSVSGSVGFTRDSLHCINELLEGSDCEALRFDERREKSSGDSQLERDSRRQDFSAVFPSTREAEDGQWNFVIWRHLSDFLSSDSLEATNES
jgi:hypothetical protein